MQTVLYDTTLRDGMQGEGVQLSVRDKIRVAHLLDHLGVSYIEGGWPGSNPRDAEFFSRAAFETLEHAKFAAFGCTRRASSTCELDPSIQALLRAGVPVLTIVGKSSLFHAQHVLGISPGQNLELIYDTVSYLRSRAAEVIFDAEHFFDGLAADDEYGLKALEAAISAGADYVVLCDTNGGSLPETVSRGFERVRASFDVRLGIHAHNDAELAVANSLAAVRSGATMIQGTVNGYGERCGNANLISIVPALVLKMNMPVVPRENLRHLTSIARTVDEMSNRAAHDWQPYVGRSAFAHKSGLHVSAQQRAQYAYEHVDPNAVGNEARVVVSDLAGRSNVAAKLRDFGVDQNVDAGLANRVLECIKQLENDGYQFEGAEASLKLMVLEAAQRRTRYFTIQSVSVHTEISSTATEPATSGCPLAMADVRLDVGGQACYGQATGSGPIAAMDAALRSLLSPFYPSLQQVHLIDYKVRVITSEAAGSVVRVVVESSDGVATWSTVGVSANIVEASFRAVVDALEYKLLSDGTAAVQPPNSLQ